VLRARAAWSRARWDRPFQPVALRSAARAAIVIPAVFAVADKVIAKPDTSLTAAFGSFAMLVLVEFAGPTRQRLAAYGGLALVGAVFITFGTLCSRDPWLAAGGMALVGFVTLFAGVFGGYVAAGSAAAILTFVLPVTLPAPNSAIPDRLEGWGLAVAAGITAVLLLWPNRRRESLNRDVAGALRAVADLVESDRDVSERAREAEEAVRGLGRRFLGSQHRPVGAAAATAALASFPDELNWLLSFLEPRSGRPPLAIACVEDAEALAAIGAVLRSSAARIETGAGEIDLARLDSARLAVAQAVMGRLAELPADLDEAALMSSLEQPFRIRVAAYSARQLADYALLATGGDVPEHDTRSPAGRTAAHSTLERTEELALTHARADSVWFQNSVRAAVGLAVAVYIAQRTGLQHGFWVVLGTLSVLRSNALGTGWSILSALGGTAAGLVAGALLVVGIGTHEAVLWGVLPVALLLAAYAPRAISFAAGQAGFTVVLFILFNIVQPVGWRVGIVRIEDVAIGFAISLGVGLLFWPRGAAARLRRDLGAAYESAVELVIATAHELGDDRGAAETAATMEREADAAIHRLDDAFRQYVSERTATRWDVEDVAALVGGASRVRRAALSVSSLAAMVDSGHRLGRCARNLDGELLGLQSWFITLAYAITNERTIPPPHLRDREGQAQLLACIREATRSRDPATVKSAAVLLWTSQHLDDLWRLEAHIAARQLDGSAPPVAANV
jgi:uncharacterized membrane protein YccC